MHGEKTHDVDIWVLAKRVCIAFGRWPKWESLLIALARIDPEQPTLFAFHLTWPLPSPGSLFTLYHPGVTVRNNEQAIQFDVSLVVCQITLTYNRKVSVKGKPDSVHNLRGWGQP